MLQIFDFSVEFFFKKNQIFENHGGKNKYITSAFKQNIDLDMIRFCFWNMVFGPIEPQKDYYLDSLGLKWSQILDFIFIFTWK